VSIPVAELPARPAAWENPSRTPTEAPADSAARLRDYVVLRLTGLMLTVLVLGHFVVTHFVTDVAHDDSAFVARRLSSAMWVAWDATMLAAALAHGAIGIRLATADYARGGRSLERAVTWIAFVVFAVGVLAIARAAHV
jgi:succinate dehydrogenase / fumarate reductase, membrane anchor subunit